MSVVQNTYDNMSDKVKTSRPRVESRSSGEEFRIAFDDDKRARDVAEELAQLLFCSPDDFAYGDREGKAVYICAEDTIIECAIAIAHLRLGYPLPPRPARESAATPDEESDTIGLPDGKTVTLKAADHTLVVEHEGVLGSIYIDLSGPQVRYGVGIQVGNVATNLNSYAEPKPAFDALLSALASAAERAAASPQRDITSERAVSARRRDEAWDELCRFVSSLSGDD